MSDVSLALRVSLSRVTILFKATQCLLMVPNLPSLHPHKLPFSFFKHIMFPLPTGPFHILIYQTDSLLYAISNKSRVFSDIDKRSGVSYLYLIQHCSGGYSTTIIKSQNQRNKF